MGRPESSTRGDLGFTLIELSVVLMILGVLFIAFAPGYNLYLKDKRFRATDARTDDIAAKMFEFRQLNGRYPCPASLTAARGTSEYGKESNCKDAAFAEGGGVYVQTSTRGITARAPFSGTPKIIIGAVPFRALNISEESAYDANGSRIVVAVTQSMTHETAFRENEGGISIVNEQGKDYYAANAAGLTGTADPEASGHFVVISPGKTQVGAYSMQGALINPCTGTAADVANCDYLPGAAHQNTAVFSANSYSEGAGNKFFDDIVKFDPGGAKTPWKFDTATGHNKEDVVNMPADKIILGPDTAANPRGELSIISSASPTDIYDGGMNVRGELNTPIVCGTDATTSGTEDCFRTADLLTECGPGQYVTGFVEGVVQCSTVYIGCASGEYMEGTNADGTPICKPIIVPQCGSAANDNWYSQPTTNMCTQSKPSAEFNVAQIGSTTTIDHGQWDEWRWNCGKGSPGGGPNLSRTQSCSTLQKVDAVCGSLDYTPGNEWTGNYITVPNPAYPNPPPVPPATTAIPPTIQIQEMVPYDAWTGRCQIASSGGGYWYKTLPATANWTCYGHNGGNTANCSFSPPPVHGQCGGAVNSCVTGSFQDAGDTSTQYLWNCNGSYGGSNASCASTKPVNGTCDNATVNACLSGSATAMSSDANYAYWTCAGSSGGSNSGQCQKAVACVAGPVDVPVNGACNNLILNGCAQGSAFDVSSDAANDYWKCSGAFGGSPSGQCQKAKPAAPVNGACNNATLNACIAGTASNISSDASYDYWRCDGLNGGANSPQCSKAKAPPPVPGICNNSTVNGCSAGSAINISSDAANDYWYCSGASGGANSPQCSKPKPGPACSGNIVYSNQSLCADGRCYGYGYDPYSLNYPAFWIVNGAYVMSGNIDPNAVNSNPSNSSFTWRASTYNSTGQPNPPPFTQTSDLVYKVSATVGGVTHNLNLTIPVASRRTPVWEPSSGAWYEGIYSTTQTAGGANCTLRANTGWWGTIGGIGARDIYGDISCSCEGRPMSPPPTCGAANDPNGHRSAGEVNNAGLCGLGMATNVSGSGPWNWTCSTPNSGASVNCSAPVCVPSSETLSPCEGNGYDAVYDNCGNFKRIVSNPACDFSGFPI